MTVLAGSLVEKFNLSTAFSVVSGSPYEIEIDSISIVANETQSFQDFSLTGEQVIR